MKRFFARVQNALIARAYRYAPEAGRRWWDEYADNKRTSRSPDRHILVKRIFPQIVRRLERTSDAKILWVGCARCTKGYYGILESKGARCWTIDIDPSARRWGRRERHTVGDLQDVGAIYPNHHFDLIVCNGVFGYGINAVEAQLAACGAMARCMRPGGLMLLGWNTNKIEDPVANGTVTRWFEPADLPRFGQRLVVGGCTHVYDVLRLRGIRGAGA